MDFNLRKNYGSIVLRWLLPRLLSKKCCDRIPRSGETAKMVNCYVIYIRNKEVELLRKVSGVDTEKNELHVNSTNPEDKKSSISEILPLSSISTAQISVDHYYKESHIYYDSIYDLFFRYVTKCDVVRVKYYWLEERLLQSRFNKKRLKILNRIELLDFLVKDQKNWDNSQSSGISPFDLMTRICPPRWVGHPDKERKKRELEMHLESLVLSGDLEKDNQGYRYIVTPKAIITLEKHKEEKCRHQDTLKIGKRNQWIGIIGAIGAIITALSMLWK